MEEEKKVQEPDSECNGSSEKTTNADSSDILENSASPSEGSTGKEEQQINEGANTAGDTTEQAVSDDEPKAETTEAEDTPQDSVNDESTPCGNELLNRLESLDAALTKGQEQAAANKEAILNAVTEVAKGQEQAAANKEAILAAVADVKNELLKKISAVKGSADMLLTEQKGVNREFREASETAVLNIILGNYREMAKAVARAQENPETALEEIGFCLQLVEDALFNLGIVKYEPEVGVDSYDARSGKQKLLAVVPTGDESLNQKIAEVVYPGFLRDDRGISDLGKAWVKVYRFDPKLVEEQKSEEKNPEEKNPEE